MFTGWPLICMATLSPRAGKRLHAALLRPPSSTRFHQPRTTTTTARNGQPACCIQGQVAMATESTCYAGCLLPSCHRIRCRRSSQPARRPTRLSIGVAAPPPFFSPCSCTKHIWRGRSPEWPPPSSNPPNTNPCVMFFSCFDSTLVSFFFPSLQFSPPSTVVGCQGGLQESKQQQTNRVVVVFVVSGDGVKMSPGVRSLTALLPVGI